MVLLVRVLLVAIAGLAVGVVVVVPRVAATSSPPAAAPVLPAADRSATRDRTNMVAVRAELRRIAEQRRLARLRVLRSRRTAHAALERAVLRGELPRAGLRRGRRTLAAAARLSRQGAFEVGAVLAATEALAEAGQLHADRLPAQLLTLDRNVQAVRSGRVPGNRERVSYPGDPLVYERYAGEGIQIQWLGSWGKVNWRAKACLERPRDCPRRRLSSAVDRLVALGARRGGFIAWEYRFRFGGGNPPWISAIAQATAAQALARAGQALRKPRYSRLARSAIRAFAAPPPVGVAVPAAGGGTHYLMYSFDPGLRILNGHVHALVALHDVAELADSRPARRLFRRGERSGEARLAAYDTGAWSLYSEGGSEATLNYHQLVAGFLDNLCSRAPDSAYCAAGRRFTRYEHEPPRVSVWLTPRLRARRPVTVRLDLSKISAVNARVEGPGGITPLAVTSMPRGPHVLQWTPARKGRHRIVVDATDPAGNHAQVRRTADVRALPRPNRRLRPPAIRVR